MAFSTHSTPAHAGFSFTAAVASVGSGIAGFFASLGRALMAASTGQARLDEAARLQAKTDVELAELGIKRDEIVHHVFRDVFWL